MRPLLVVAAWCLVGAPVWACNVPVFRYALERWAPAPYYLGVFHTSDDAQSVRDLLGTLEDRPINIHAEAVDVDEIEEDDWRLAGVELDRENLPWAVMFYPPRGPHPSPIAWSGQLDKITLDSLISSSIRQEVVRRLLTGESGVWVLVESGDREKDETARKTLERYLAKAKSHFRIPGVGELDYSVTDAPELPAFYDSAVHDPDEIIPLKVDFSLLSLSRDNAAEQGFLAMLLNSEPDLDEHADEPIVFPMFGQGRMLWALVGKGINEGNIFESCMFLTGPCSCEVQTMNPGTDMVMEFDWWGALEGRVPPPPEISPEMLTGVAPLLDDEMDQHDSVAMVSEEVGGDERRETGISREVASVAPTRPAAPEDAAAAEPGAQGIGAPVLVVTGAVLGGLLVVVAAVTLVLVGKKKE
ncbi:MAG: hypothetical protein EA424_26910 [Planctomycetaceae bacterium]|nr:MAG: hypothetical protein EA424_26910 [Planctomycetaceae bacterium]